jgi:hypothetical protein
MKFFSNKSYLIFGILAVFFIFWLVFNRGKLDILFPVSIVGFLAIGFNILKTNKLINISLVLTIIHVISLLFVMFFASVIFGNSMGPIIFGKFLQIIYILKLFFFVVGIFISLKNKFVKLT